MPIVKNIQLAALHLAVGCWLTCGLVSAQPVAQAPGQAPVVTSSSAEQKLLAVAALPRMLDYALQLPDDAPVAVAWRDALRALLARERPRMVRLMSDWLDEELKTGRSRDFTEASEAVGNRMFNEMTLWRMDSAGPAHDRRLVQAALRPAACTQVQNPPYMVELGNLLAQVPAAEQAAALAAEDALLRRWGLPRPRAEALPAPWVDDVAWRHIERLRETGTPPPLPLPPWLAWNFLVETPDEALKHDSVGLCRLRQWQLALASADPASGVNDAFWARQRLLLAPLVTRWWRMREPADAAPTDYPRLALRLGVTGTTQVSFAVDAQGKPREARVVGRKITVPGIDGQRAVGFETLLDAASLRRLQAVKVQATGAAQQTVEFVWSLQ